MFSLLLSVECYHAGIVLPNNAGVNRAANCLSGDNRCGNLYGVSGCVCLAEHILSTKLAQTKLRTK